MALLALVVVGLVSLDRALEAYLVGYLFWLNVAVGSLPILMLQYVTGGAWGMSIRRILEAATRTILPMLLGFVPIALGVRLLFLWARPEVVAHDEILQHKELYLNVPFFLVRAAIYFAAWIGLAFTLTRWSDEQQRTGSRRLARRLELASGPGIVLYGLTVTFASFDWAMSLEPHWFSHIYGALYAIGQILGAFTFAIAVLVLLADREPLARYVGAEQFHDLGKLLLAFVMVWAYFSFSQFLIIWAANLPEEIVFYLERMHGGWAWIGILLVLLHFALPFLLLLSRSLKRDARRLAFVAIGVFAVRFLDLFWSIAPAFEDASLAVSLPLALLAGVGVGGIWLALFLSQLEGRGLLPTRDPYFEPTMTHGTH